jgi:mono/diheme cytochrome c family protein
MGTYSRTFALGLALVSANANAQTDPDLLTGLDLGRHVFLTYCSGCHGFDGQAFYPGAPSFAMGEALNKSDAELMNTILDGKGHMPSWESKLPRPWLETALDYIRFVATNPVPADAPDYYYIFAPLGSDITSDTLYWDVPR